MITLILHLLEKDGNKIEQRVKFVNISNTVDFCVENEQIVWNTGKSFSRYANWDREFPPKFMNTLAEEIPLRTEYELALSALYELFIELNPK